MRWSSLAFQSWLSHFGKDASFLGRIQPRVSSFSSNFFFFFFGSCSVAIAYPSLLIALLPELIKNTDLKSYTPVFLEFSHPSSSRLVSLPHPHLLLHTAIAPGNERALQACAVLTHSAPLYVSQISRGVSFSSEI